MLIHANRRWSEAIDAHLWPYAIRYASDILNEAPMKRNANVTPMELFSASKVRFNPRHNHMFGNPVYVLDNVLQQGQTIPKWSERARVGIFLGFSPQHARSVSLMLSLSSGLTSPQFHVQFDDGFQTIKASFGNTPPISQWQHKCGFARRKPKEPDKTTQQEEIGFVPRGATLEIPPIPEGASNEGADPANEGEPEEPQGSNDNPTEVAPQLRRSRREPRPTMRYHEYVELLVEEMAINEMAVYLPDATLQQASADPDIMYWHEAMKEPDKYKFIKAAQQEVLDHTINGLWEVVPRSKVPQGKLISRGVWTMHRKRKIGTQEVYKWKSQLAYDGSKQTKDVNYWDTYAPVISWPIVRYVLTLALTQQWHIKQIDYVLVYTQAVAETNMYMEAPKGFTFDTQGSQNAKDYVL
ncbi:hypothetical protein ACA910_020079 [Epithemia clementina (nom. ined.)]